MDLVGRQVLQAYVGVKPERMHNVMSITKGALGLVYSYYNVDTSQPLWPAWDGCKLTLEHCLNHQAGMHDISPCYGHWNHKILNLGLRYNVVV